jgi:SagB-type dehydrogenase family enzyme
MVAYVGYRNVPSGGALYPLEIYMIVFNSHIESGVYHYRADINSLEQLKTGNFVEELLNIIQAEPYVNMKSSSCLIITTGVIERVIIKYGDRGYRFMMQEVGFVAQTISLLSESIGLSSCMLGGYNDDKVNSFIGIDGVFEAVNNIIVIGKGKIISQ